MLTSWRGLSQGRGWLLRAAPQLAEHTGLTTIQSSASKEYPAAPNVGIGVVILRRIDNLHQVLLVRRAKEPQKGLLTFPGGSLELGETMAECAIRETLEETGLTLRNEQSGGETHHRSLECPRPVDAVDSIHYDAKGHIQYHYTIVDLAAVPENPDAEPTAADDVDAVFWAPIPQLREMPGLGEHIARISEQAVQRFDV